MTDDKKLNNFMALSKNCKFEKVDPILMKMIKCCEEENLDDLKELIENNLETYKNFSHVLLAYSVKNLEIVKYLYEKDPDSAYIGHVEIACRGGNLDVVKYLISKGLDIRESEDLVYLTLIASVKHLHILKYLIEELGIDPTINDNSVIFHAYYSDKTDAVNYLLEKDCKLPLINVIKNRKDDL